VNIQLE